jgi:hypothetical protein
VKRAEQAELELRVLREGLRANGADPTQIQNLWAQIRLRNRQWRDAKRERDEAQAERDKLRQVLHLLRYGMARAKDAQLSAAYVVELIDRTTETVMGQAPEPCDRDQQYARAERAEAAIERIARVVLATLEEPNGTNLLDLYEKALADAHSMSVQDVRKRYLHQLRHG